MRCVVVVCLAIALLGVGPARGRAQPAGEAVATRAPAVALLPLATAEAKLRIYGKPVADAIASALRDAGISVLAIAPGGEVPARVDLVVDGRIVATKGGVLLEARVRDPGRGTVMASLASTTASLTEIDSLAANLGADLAPVIDRALAAQRLADAADAAARKPKPAGGGSAKIETGEPPETKPGGDAVEAARPVAPRVDRRPAMVVFTAAPPRQSATEADPAVIAAVTTRDAVALAERLGYRPVLVADTGIPGADTAAQRLASATARHGLAFAVDAVSFTGEDVMAARGRVRVVLVGADGAPLFDRVARTDTVVGSRGDRHDALIHFVAAQVADIVAPRLREVLPAASASR